MSMQLGPTITAAVAVPRGTASVHRTTNWNCSQAGSNFVPVHPCPLNCPAALILDPEQAAPTPLPYYAMQDLSGGPGSNNNCTPSEQASAAATVCTPRSPWSDATHTYASQAKP